MLVKKETFELDGVKYPVYPKFFKFGSDVEFSDSIFHKELLDEVHKGAPIEPTVQKYIDEYNKCQTRSRVDDMIEQGAKYFVFHQYGTFTVEEMTENDFELASQLSLIDYNGFYFFGNTAEPTNF